MEFFSMLEQNMHSVKKKKQLNMHGAMKKKKMNKMNMVHDFCAVGGLIGVWISW